MTDATASVISMDASGRFVLPKAVRDQLCLKPGSRFSVEVVAGRIELTPQDDEEVQLVRVNGRLVLRAPPSKVGVAAASVADREEQAQRGWPR